MMSARDLSKQPLAALIEECQRQSSPTEQAQTKRGFCLEIFRRAIQHEDPAAWEFIQSNYHKLMMHWVQRAATTSLSFEDMEDLVQESFLKFWRTIGRRPETFSQKFSHIGSVLRYLQQCATSACIDFQRHQSRQQIVEESLQQSKDAFSQAVEFKEVDREMIARIELIREWLETALKDEREKLIIFHSFYDGWSPKKIYKEYPERFSAVEEVRKIKIRVMKRAKRTFRS